MRALFAVVLVSVLLIPHSDLVAQATSDSKESVASKTTHEVRRIVDNLVDLLLGSVPGTDRLREPDVAEAESEFEFADSEAGLGNEVTSMVEEVLVEQRVNFVDRELECLDETLDLLLEPTIPETSPCEHGACAGLAFDHDSDTEWSDWHRFTWRRHGRGIAFGASALYPEDITRHLPATRYNRVEGFVLGAGFPLYWNTGLDRWRPFGQIGYAFGLDEWRYELGLETRLSGQSMTSGIRLGGSYYQNTATNDTWKVDGWENNVAAFFMENDYLDYYELEGFTTYLAAGLGPYSELSLAYRSDSYTSLDRITGWSLFDGPGFRSNPGVDELDLRSLVARFQGGRVASLYGLPHGFSIQAEAEYGDGLGGDVDFQRYVGDARFYVSPGHVYGLALRLRGAYATDDAPIQKQFTAGGIGTVRAYDQNHRLGTRLALANAEFVVDNVDLILSDLQLFTFTDVGWTGSDGSSLLDSDGLISAAGFGVGFDQRRLRFEVAFPLRGDDQGEPWFWFRLNPTF